MPTHESEPPRVDSKAHAALTLALKKAFKEYKDKTGLTVTQVDQSVDYSLSITHPNYVGVEVGMIEVTSIRYETTAEILTELIYKGHVCVEERTNSKRVIFHGALTELGSLIDRHR